MSDENQTQQTLPPPPPPPAGGVEVQQVAPAGDVAARHARRLQARIPYTDVTLIVGSRDQNGHRQEKLINIDGRDYRIVGVEEKTIEKVMKVKDENGNLMGFEPTGEYELTIKVRYVQE